MLGITMHHYVRAIFGIPADPTVFAALPVSANKLIIEIIFLPIGKIGVVAFFTISAWFLCNGRTRIRDGFRRVWLLERELLFWSLTLLLVTLLINPKQVGLGLAIKSLLPVSTNMWWYATSYIVFLLLFPFITVGLRALGGQWHLLLCLVTFLLWSVVGGFLPQITFNMTFNSVFAFIYLYILVSYVRWYGHLPSRQFGWALVISGTMIIVIWVSVFEWFSTITTKAAEYPMRIADAENKLPVVLIGIGWFIIFCNIHFVNRVINRVAKSALSVFLITVYPGLEVFRLYDASVSFNSPTFAIKVIVFGVCAYAVCTLLDFIRQWLFTLTIDRHRGKWFSLAWERGETAWGRIYKLATEVSYK